MEFLKPEGLARDDGGDVAHLRAAGQQHGRKGGSAKGALRSLLQAG